jgi:F-type H+-transporting ATPase subunit delta
MNKAARRYSTALYEVAEEMKLLDETERDFSEIKKLIEGSREFRLFLQSPIISRWKKRQILSKILEDRLNKLSLRFIDLISSKNRETILYDISRDYLELLNERRGIIEAEIKTVIEIPDKEKKALVEKLKRYTGKEIKPVFKVDKDIKGGFVAQIKDTIIDASIKRQLELLREQLNKGNLNN